MFGCLVWVNQRVIGCEANQFCMGCMGLDVASFGTVAVCAAVHAWEGPCGSRPIIWCGRLTYVGMVERKAFEGGRQAIGPESVGRARQQASCCCWTTIGLGIWLVGCFAIGPTCLG